MLDSIIASILSSMDKSSFGIQEKIFFFKELAYLIDGGVSLMDAVQIVYDSTDNYAIKEISLTIKTTINNGKPVSYALSRLLDYFDDADITIVKSGEKTGNLAQVLKSLAYEYSYINTIKNKYQGAMIYPTILIVIAVGAIISLFMFVLPKIFQIVQEMNMTELPPLTAALKTISDFMLAYWYQMLIGIVLVWGWLFTYFSTTQGQKNLTTIVMGIPIIGKMTKYYYLIKFCRYLKIMISAGMTYVETFAMLKGILSIPAYDTLLDGVRTGLTKGQTIHSSIRGHSALMPANAIALLKVGEETANLPQSLDNIVAIYEEDLNNMLNNLSKIIEPVMLVVIGGIIVVIAIGVFWVIMNVMDSVQV